MKKRDDLLKYKEEILEHIKNHGSKAELCRRYHCKPETLNVYLKKMNINYKGNQPGKGIKKDEGYVLAKEYFNDEKFIKSSTLREKLIKEGYKENKCEKCGLSIWLGENIPLELHHKDGNHYNNRLENLEVLCPNCHALETKKTNKKHKRVYCKNNRCVDCGTPITRNAVRCLDCNKKIRFSK